MCGIAGWYRRTGQPIDPGTITGQLDTIIHRGPDDSGELNDGDFGFGMRRLSIIDLEGGHQPIATADRRHVIVFNGEIYNHRELRRELETRGVRFTTHSDTETLLQAYLLWGNDAWTKLEGMYAAAIWDRKTRRLVLARDPMGIKPLYLTRQNGGLAFASEIRALKALPDHNFSIDERGLHDFFSYGHVQKPRSIYTQVRSLDPGHVLEIGPDGDPAVTRFWQPRFAPFKGMSEKDWIEETRHLMQATVRHHMLADVTVGAFLSGGVDSSAITAAMMREATAPVKAFTLGFPGTTIDETQAASRIARHLGAEHIVLPLEPGKAGEMLPQVQAAFDEPCAATAAVPIWHLSRLAAEHVKVVLCGEGADEIFAGYKRQRTALSAARNARRLQFLRPLIDAMPETRFKRLNYFRQNARRFRNSALLDSGFQRFFFGTQISSPELRAQIYDSGFYARHEQDSAFARLENEYFPDPADRALGPLEQFMLADITVHMPGSLLNRLDRASMAHSLEARVPFLSHRFVDWVLTMPQDMKLRGKIGKYALRKAVEPWLPPNALGKRKLGFQLPFAEWFSGDFSTFAREAWQDSGAAASGYLDRAAVDRLFDEHRQGTANHGRMLYAIAMFSCWWQQNINSPR